MDWIYRFNESIEYMEQHLANEIDYGELGKIACCSTYHYQRMFTYMAGIPLSEYIRRRKMSLAAVDLQQSNAKIIGAEEMEYRIETKEAFRIIGVAAPLSKELEKNFTIVPQMWQTASMDGTFQKLAALMDTPLKGLLGVSACGDAEEWKYFIAVASNQTETDFESYEIPASTWAIFSGEGTNQSIQQLEQRIVTEWLPTSGYEYGNAPDIEVYLSPDPNNAKYEVWIPVQKKQ